MPLEFSTSASTLFRTPSPPTGMLTTLSLLHGCVWNFLLGYRFTMRHLLRPWNANNCIFTTHSLHGVSGLPATYIHSNYVVSIWRCETPLHPLECICTTRRVYTCEQAIIIPILGAFIGNYVVSICQYNTFFRLHSTHWNAACSRTSGVFCPGISQCNTFWRPLEC